MSTGAPTLSIEGVYKAWSGVPLLNGVDLALTAGRLTWLGGDNGAGKTTLLRIASGLLVPEAGMVRLGDWTPDTHRRSYSRSVALLSAGDRGLYARLTVRQNLEFGAGMAMLPRSRRRQVVEDALSQFELEDLARRRVDRLSMGQRQRVRLALTFLPEPLVVLLDEPRTSLDETGLDLLATALANLARRGGSALWCSPTGDEPPVPMDDLFVLVDGKVLPL